MKALIHEKIAGVEGVNWTDTEKPEPKTGEVLIKLQTAGMNRRDLAVITKRHKENDPPLIPGSDGAGVVEATGNDVKRFDVGQEVIINPSLGWEQNSDVPPEGFNIVGFPDDGTFAEYIVLPESQVEKKPTQLSWDEAGVLGLAALTAYRALFTRGNLQKDETVMLPGIGSGVLTFALKYAKAAGARVIVTSRSEEKLEEAKKLGADRGILTGSDWNEELKDEAVDVLIESIGAATFEKSLGIIRRGGTIVTFGATTDDEVTIDIRKFFYGQYNLLGSTMGSREEFREMLQFIEQHEIKPEIDRMFEAENYADAFNYLEQSKNFGKIGFRINQ